MPLADAILLQQLIGGLAFGVIYALVALGFTMLVRALDLVHFGYGEILMLGGLIGFSLTASIGLPYAVALPTSMAAAAVASGASAMLVFLPLRRRGSPLLNMMIATIGISVALQSAGRLIWGSHALDYPQVFRNEPYLLGGVRIPPYAPWVLAIGIVIMLGLQWFFATRATGIAMRAVSDDLETAQLMGINPDRMILYTLSISGALGGAAGALVAPIVFASSDMGVAIGIKAFAAATIGGLGSMKGAVVGGLLIGLVETSGAALISSAYKDAFAYGLLILVLLVRPRGLIGGQKSGETLL